MTRPLPQCSTADQLRDAVLGDARKKRSIKSDPATELRRLNAAALEFCEALRALSPEAAAIYRNPRDSHEKVRMIGVIAGVAAANTASISQMSVEAVPSQKRPRIRPPVALAREAALVFIMISGERPARRNDGRVREFRGQARAISYGPFMDFLAAVFDARRMKASPENCAKEALALIDAMENEVAI